MNILEALQQLFPTLPDENVQEPGPQPAPAGMYFVISEPGDADQGVYHAGVTGHVPQRRTLTVLVTQYGEEGWQPADLRPHYERLRHGLSGLITTHPALPPLSRVERGAAKPPELDRASRRPWAGVRVHLTYLE